MLPGLLTETLGNKLLLLACKNGVPEQVLDSKTGPKTLPVKLFLFN